MLTPRSWACRRMDGLVRQVEKQGLLVERCLGLDDLKIHVNEHNRIFVRFMFLLTFRLTAAIIAQPDIMYFASKLS